MYSTFLHHLARHLGIDPIDSPTNQQHVSRHPETNTRLSLPLTSDELARILEQVEEAQREADAVEAENAQLDAQLKKMTADNRALGQANARHLARINQIRDIAAQL
eukprot:m.111225 g.111225  ORF g.111225 m.111225 type:complete len:106 (-) comp9082_c0_seq4:1325-1642(-)